MLTSGFVVRTDASRRRMMDAGQSFDAREMGNVCETRPLLGDAVRGTLLAK